MPKTLSRTHSCFDCSESVNDEARGWTLHLEDGKQVPLCEPCGFKRMEALS